MDSSKLRLFIWHPVGHGQGTKFQSFVGVTQASESGVSSITNPKIQSVGKECRSLEL